MIKKLPPGLSMLGSVVSICTNNFTSEEQAREVAEFFKDKDTKGFDRALAQSLDTIAAKASWVARDKDEVEKWLKDNEYLPKEYRPKL